MGQAPFLQLSGGKCVRFASSSVFLFRSRSSGPSLFYAVFLQPCSLVLHIVGVHSGSMWCWHMYASLSMLCVYNIFCCGMLRRELEILTISTTGLCVGTGHDVKICVLLKKLGYQKKADQSRVPAGGWAAAAFSQLAPPSHQSTLCASHLST